MNTDVVIIIVAVLVLLAVVAFLVLKKEKFSTTTPRPTLSNLQYTQNIINVKQLDRDIINPFVKQLDTSNLPQTDLTSIFNDTKTFITENLVYINIALKSPESPQSSNAFDEIMYNLSKYRYSGPVGPVAPVGPFYLYNSFSLYLFIRYYTNLNTNFLSQLNTNANYIKVLKYFPEFPSLLSSHGVISAQNIIKAQNIINVKQLDRVFINPFVEQLDTSNLPQTDLTSIFNDTKTFITENLVYINIVAKSSSSSSSSSRSQQIIAEKTISDNISKYRYKYSDPVYLYNLYLLYLFIRYYTNLNTNFLSQLNTNANYIKVLKYFPEFPSLLSSHGVIAKTLL
jgi:hypothetical protein